MQEEMNMYTGFASVYDLLMDNIPYDDWCEYLISLLRKNGISSGIVVDLACGTGEITKRLSEAGYDMIGVDLSEEMLGIARQKCNENVLLLQQDMTELDLYGSAAAMVCICDGMNYMTGWDELTQVFQKVSLFLDKNGIFIFDMKTEYFYQEVLGNRTIAENRDNVSYIWENTYYEEEKINEYLLTIYEKEEGKQNLFRRTDEIHQQMSFEIEKVKKYLLQQGLECQNVFEAFTEDAPKQNSERIYFVAKKI